MATWAEFAEAAPEMAQIGLGMLPGIAYLATVRGDGAPRVHPVCPFIGEGRLFVTTAPTSPKRHDLLHAGRYVLHMPPGKDDAEFLVRGRATLVRDDATRAIAIEAGRRAVQSNAGFGIEVKPQEWLFEYDIEQAASAYWEHVGQPNTRPVRSRWEHPGPPKPQAQDRPRSTPGPPPPSATWAQFERAAPEMAALGHKQFEKFHIAYLATVRRDGAPRVHPASPIIADGRLFVATAPNSPKRLDLLHDGRYVIHALPGKNDEEFLIRGRAHRVEDEATRRIVVDTAGHTVRNEDWIFEYAIERAGTTYWENVGQPNTRPIRRRWRQS